MPEYRITLSYFKLFLLLQVGCSEPYQANIERFLSTLDKMGLPGFQNSDLEQVLSVSLMVDFLICGVQLGW